MAVMCRSRGQLQSTRPVGGVTCLCLTSLLSTGAGGGGTPETSVARLAPDSWRLPVGRTPAAGGGPFLEGVGTVWHRVCMERPSVESVPSGKALGVVTAPHVVKSDALPVGRWPGPQTETLRAHQLEDGHTRAGFQPRMPWRRPRPPARSPERRCTSPTAEGRGPDTSPLRETPRHPPTQPVRSEGRTDPWEMTTRRTKPRARVHVAALCPKWTRPARPSVGECASTAGSALRCGAARSQKGVKADSRRHADEPQNRDAERNKADAKGHGV